jgi:hypothetical protein
VKKEVSQQVVQSEQEAWQRRQGMDEAKLLSWIPDHLRIDVFCELAAPILVKVCVCLLLSVVFFSCSTSSLLVLSIFRFLLI